MPLPPALLVFFGISPATYLFIFSYGSNIHAYWLIWNESGSYLTLCFSLQNVQFSLVSHCTSNGHRMRAHKFLRAIALPSFVKMFHLSKRSPSALKLAFTPNTHLSTSRHLKVTRPSSCFLLLRMPIGEPINAITTMISAQTFSLTQGLSLSL